MFHERCQCQKEDIETCKEHCDQDTNCKGFVGPTAWEACQWATTSECPTGCQKYDQGHVGDLLWDEEHHSDNYPGCFVKLEGKNINAKYKRYKKWFGRKINVNSL